MHLNQRQVYEGIVAQFKFSNEHHFETKDKLNKAANLYAMRISLKIWKRQWK